MISPAPASLIIFTLNFLTGNGRSFGFNHTCFLYHRRLSVFIKFPFLILDRWDVGRDCF